MADLVLEKLGESVHKLPKILHIFICLKFMDELVVYSPSGRGVGGGILNV